MYMSSILFYIMYVFTDIHVICVLLLYSEIPLKANTDNMKNRSIRTLSLIPFQTGAKWYSFLLLICTLIKRTYL